MKLQVKPEFAGRSAHCPTCKRPISVPREETTKAYVPAEQIDGLASSVFQAGVDAGITLAQPGAPSGQPSVGEMLANRPRQRERYVIGGEVGRGGMGAVLRAVDRDIRREVAIKFLLDQADSHKKLRFIEEAQINGQLEHPNIVPIHELGIDSQKRFFFAMKMVRGRSLAQVITQLRKDPKTAEKDYSLTRLLSVFVNVCNALAYAHARGVVHRDLKPANIMIGDFGEVYVMDWGIAKVLGREERVPADAGAQRDAHSSGRIATARGADVELTQPGAILGTPAFMSPEQATGRIEAIDQRSDIYSLGAILYELLTLQPPVDTQGGYYAILMRVAQGEIVPPEQRAPDRGRRGKIPRELSAIALKALAKGPADRYPDAEALRRDIERFQEGRSVSAKEDTLREALWKLAKRNKQASITALIAVVVLSGIIWLSFRLILAAKGRAEDARARTQETLVALQNEQGIKHERGKNTAPFFVRDAKISADQKQFDYALAQLSVALDYDPEQAAARLLKSQLLIVKKDFAAAQRELQQYLRQRPDDRDAAELLELSGQARPDDASSSAPFVPVFARQKAFTLAEQMTKDRNQLRELYRQRIETAWPGRGSRLTVDPDGKLHLALAGCPEVGDLTPLRGMRLTELQLGNCPKVRDLAPLTGMPLKTLTLANTAVGDLSPLKGMELTSLMLGACSNVRDLEPLEGMPLTHLYIADCWRLHDLTPLERLKKLEEISLTPRYVDTGMEVLRPWKMKSLKKIIVKTPGQTRELAPVEFWRLYDKGEFQR
jgi:serine/threonine protein kinase